MKQRLILLAIFTLAGLYVLTSIANWYRSLKMQQRRGGEHCLGGCNRQGQDQGPGCDMYVQAILVLTVFHLYAITLDPNIT